MRNPDNWNMAKLNGKPGLILLAVAVAAAAAVLWMRRASGPDDGSGAPTTERPHGRIAEVDESGRAGQVMRMKGDMWMRTTEEKIDLAAELSDPKSGGWKPVAGETHFPMRAAFRLAAGSELQLRPHGGYVVNLDGEGEFVLLDATTGADRKDREIVWLVKRGMLRIKPHDADPARHVLVLRTPKGEVRGENASMGLRVNDAQGNGQVWVMDGKASLRMADGTTRELPLKAVQGL